MELGALLTVGAGFLLWNENAHGLMIAGVVVGGLLATAVLVSTPGVIWEARRRRARAEFIGRGVDRPGKRV